MCLDLASDATTVAEGVSKKDERSFFYSFLLQPFNFKLIHRFPTIYSFCTRKLTVGILLRVLAARCYWYANKNDKMDVHLIIFKTIYTLFIILKWLILCMWMYLRLQNVPLLSQMGDLDPIFHLRALDLTADALAFAFLPFLGFSSFDPHMNIIFRFIVTRRFIVEICFIMLR